MREAVNDPEFKSAMDKLETPVAFKQGEDFQRFFEADAKRLAKASGGWAGSRRRSGRLRPLATSGAVS